MDFAWLCFCLLIIRFACGVVAGATAIGNVMLSMPLLMLLFTPGDAVLLSIIMSVFAVPQMAWMYRRYCSFKDILDLIVGSIPGCILGGLVVKFASAQMLQLMICAMLFTFVALQCLRRTPWALPDRRSIGLFAGGVCGFVSSAVAMSGAPLGIYALLRQWSPDRARGNMSMFYVFSVFGAALTQAGAGLYTPALFKLAVAGVVGSIAGQYLGYTLGRHVNQEMFRRIVTAFLALAACILLWRAVMN